MSRSQISQTCSLLPSFCFPLKDFKRSFSQNLGGQRTKRKRERERERRDERVRVGKMMSNCAEGIQDSGFETEFVSIGTIPLSLPENESRSIDYGMNERRKEEREREVRMRGVRKRSGKKGKRKEGRDEN